jgi:hypothetical protein
LTHSDYDNSFDFAFLNTLVNQHVRNGHTLSQALNRALLLGRLRHTNALIRCQEGIQLLCAVRPNHLWLDFKPCCDGDEALMNYRKRGSSEFLKCRNCKKRAEISARLKPSVLSQFLTEPVPTRDLVFEPLGEWVSLKLPRYGQHPLWTRSDIFHHSAP